MNLNEAVKVRREATISLLCLSSHAIHYLVDECVRLEHLRVQSIAHTQHASTVECHIVVKAMVSVLRVNELRPLSCLIDRFHLVVT